MNRLAALLIALLLAPSARAVWPEAMMATANSRPRMTNDPFPVAWGTRQDAAGYRLYLGPSPSSMTNRVEMGTNTSAVLMLTPGQLVYMAMRCYNAYDLESPNSNILHYPGDVVVTVVGNELVRSPSPDFRVQAFVDSPWTAVNPQGVGFLKCLDGSPATISKTIRYGD